MLAFIIGEPRGIIPFGGQRTLENNVVYHHGVTLKLVTGADTSEFEAGGSTMCHGQPEIREFQASIGPRGGKGESQTELPPWALASHGACPLENI